MKRLLHRTQLGLHLPMLLVAFLFLAPLLWMLSTAFKSPEDIINGLGALRWVPRPITTENFTYVLGKAEEFPVWRWTGNSLFISFAVTELVRDSAPNVLRQRRAGTQLAKLHDAVRRVLCNAGFGVMVTKLKGWSTAPGGMPD